MPVTVIPNEEEFKQELEKAGGKLVVVDFHATWCGPCKMIAPKIEEFSTKYPGVVFLKVDVDEAEDVATAYEISGMPTFIFFKNKAKLETIMGANAEKIKEQIEKLK